SISYPTCYLSLFIECQRDEVVENLFITDDVVVGEHRGSGGLISGSISIDNIHYRYLMYVEDPVRSSQTSH
ncbi:MAG: hypothetical protein ACRC16_08475, partial [Aeromonas salmonicida]